MGDPDQPVIQRGRHVGPENHRRQTSVGQRKEMRDYRSRPERQYGRHGGKFETGLVGRTAFGVSLPFIFPPSVFLLFFFTVGQKKKIYIYEKFVLS